MDNDEGVELADVANGSLALTKRFLTDIQGMLDGKGGKKGIEKMTVRDKQNVTGMLTKLMRAAAALIKESRALEKDAVDSARKLSYDQKRVLVLEFIRMMPQEHQRALREELGWHLVAV